MPKKNTTSKTSDKISQITSTLLSHLDYPDAKVEVSRGEDDHFIIHLTVDPEDSGILIGYHGETITSLQLTLSLIMNHQLGEWHHLSLNVNDYREKRQSSLEEMAQNAAERAESTGEEVIMPPMGSYDRRIIHMALSEVSGIKTESVGEGKDRRLVVSLQSTTPDEE